MTDYHCNFNIDGGTTAEEIIDYTEYRLQSPINIDSVTIYNFSTHEADFDALNHAVQTKLKYDTYIIPIQITSASLFIHSILPEQLKEAEILLYRENEEVYYAYSNFDRQIPVESKEGIKQEFAEIIRKQ